MTRAERWLSALHRRRRVAIAGVVCAALGLGAMARTIRVDNSLDVWFVDGDPALAAYDAYRERFGNDEIVVIAAVAPDSAYAPAALERVRAASDRLAEHPLVRRVNSITRGLHVSGSAGAIDIEPLLGDGPVTPEEAERVRARVEADPAFRGVVIGRDERTTLILVEPRVVDDFDAVRSDLLADIRAIVDDTLRSGGATAHIGGLGVVYDGLNAASMRDSAVFVTLSYLVLLGGLWLLFGRWVWVAVGAAVATVTVVATLGIAGWAGRDLNMVTGALPTLLITVGLMDLVHLIDAGTGGGRRALAAMAVIAAPCAVNTVTDAIGFSALASAPLAAVRDLGWLAAAGLAVGLASVFAIGVPAVVRFGGAAPRRAGGDIVARATAALYRVARDRRGAVLAGTLAVFAISAAGIARLDVDTYTIGFLDEDHPVRRDHAAIERHFGPYVPLELEVDARADGGVVRPELLRALDRAERAVEAHPAVSRVTGLPEIVKRVHQVYMDGDPTAYAIPGDARVVAEELLTYSFSADGRDTLDALVDPPQRRTHITARTGLPTARGIAAIVRDAEAAARGALGDRADVRAAGYLPLYVRIIQYITETQLRSFALCLVAVALVLVALLRSVKLGVVALVPNLLPALMTLGLMGYCGIRLDVATVLIASIAIGIAVNDTCHILFRYRHERRQPGATPTSAVEATMRHAGHAVVATSVLLIAGFSVLAFASVQSLAYFGVLTAATVAFALVADLLVTPALLLAVDADATTRNAR